MTKHKIEAALDNSTYETKGYIKLNKILTQVIKLHTLHCKTIFTALEKLAAFLRFGHCNIRASLHQTSAFKH